LRPDGSGNHGDNPTFCVMPENGGALEILNIC
jgi:hypothetical protein